MITKCNMLAWVGPGPEREQRLCGTVDNNESSLYNWFCKFPLNLKLFQNELLLLYISSCLDEAMGSKLETQLFHFS